MLQQNISQSQQQTLSLEQRQSLQILAFNNQELDAFLTEEYLQNPLLERDDSRRAEALDSIDVHYESASSYRDQYFRYEDEDGDRRGDIRAREPSSIASQLKEQLTPRGYSREEWALVDYLISCLDEKGFFHYTAQEIASACGQPVERVEKCLGDLRRLEPAGIFTSDLSECLLMQLDERGDEDKVLRRLISERLPDLLSGNVASLSRSLGITASKCRACIQKIGELNPRPIMNTEADSAGYIVPDILAVREDGAWKISLNDGWIGEYRFNDYYLHMMQSSKDPAMKEYFRGHLERARLIVSSIERRRASLISIAETVLDIQEDFFLRGGALVPMTMDQVARRLQISTSTVSRAVKNKYLQYRRPVLLRDLFSCAASENTDAAADSVRSRIKELVNGEDHAHPFSDDRLAKLLEKEGMRISRRTVAKYRQQLGIPDSRLRSYL